MPVSTRHLCSDPTGTRYIASRDGITYQCLGDWITGGSLPRYKRKRPRTWVAAGCEPIPTSEECLAIGDSDE